MSGLISCVPSPRATALSFSRNNSKITHCQTCPNTELIVVDDGKKSVAALCKNQPNVRHIRLAQKTHIGTKMNIGIEAAKGNILQKLDDDDYYAPEFLNSATWRLNAAKNPNALVAWCCFAVLISPAQANSTTPITAGRLAQPSASIVNSGNNTRSRTPRAPKIPSSSKTTSPKSCVSAQQINTSRAPRSQRLERHPRPRRHLLRRRLLLAPATVSPKSVEQLTGESAAFYRALLWPQPRD